MACTGRSQSGFEALRGGRCRGGPKSKAEKREAERNPMEAAPQPPAR
jgi:hypothetical protein